MKEEVKNKWLELIVMPSYRRGLGVMRIGDTYDVAGLLCKLHGEENNLSWKKHSNSDYYSYGGNEIFPPVEVLDWAGLSADKMSQVIDKSEMTKLSNKEIAQFIVSNC